MSAHTVVRQPGLVEHLRPQRSGTAAALLPTGPGAAMAQGLSEYSGAEQLTRASMRFLEASLAFAAIATALLLGLGR